VRSIGAFAACIVVLVSIKEKYRFKAHKEVVDQSFSATGSFFNGGTCALQVGTNDFSGTYVVAKNGKSVKLALGAGGKAAMLSYINSLIASSSEIPAGLTVTVKSFRFTKVKLSGNDLAAASAASGTVAEGKKKRSFSVKTLWTGSLASGTAL